MLKIFSRTGRLFWRRNSRQQQQQQQQVLNQKSTENLNIQYFNNLNAFSTTQVFSKTGMAEQSPQNNGASGGSSATTATTTSKKTNMEKPKFTNRLAEEKSPYLLQHAHNPVDWYPWGDEAIQRAKKENKLIFLSVGYSTCHWCHVMEHESFENEDVAKIMNENFINIKVDREERPDIDKIYMNFVLMINGSGGWPMSVWLTPDLAPISAGTYFPPKDRWGMPGFTTILNKIAEKWRKNKEELIETGQNVIKAIEKSFSEKSTENLDSGSAEAKLDLAIRIYKRNFDKEYGGLGNHPKFPEVSRLQLLFHAYSVKKDPAILEIALLTLRKIAQGGIHDHIFGGFARYSVDKEWHVPHFEKMLYDQGQLIQAYANAYKITKDSFYLETANKIFNYIMKDLKHPEGGFYSGEDADSLPTAKDSTKIEGAFYAWTWSEIHGEIQENSDSFDLDPDKVTKIYCYHYDIQKTGNVSPSSDPHGHLTAKNILIVRKSMEDTSKIHKIEKDELSSLLEKVNNILHKIREKRPRPHLDTKILTAWNGLVLSGLAKLADCGGDRKDEYLDAAKNLVEFLKKFAYNKEKKVLLRSCYGKGTNDPVTEVLLDPVEGFLDDYAFLIKGLIDYYRATLDTSLLEWAKELQCTQDKLFWDNIQGGYFYSKENSPNVVIRMKEDHDGAEPCGNSVAARNLLLLSAYYEEDKYIERATKLFDYFKDSNPFGYVLPEMMSALLLKEHGFDLSAVVSNDSSDKSTQKLLNILRKYYVPGLLIVHYNSTKESKIKAKSQEKFKMINNSPTVYICHNKVCQLPITDPKKLEDNLHTNYRTIV